MLNKGTSGFMSNSLLIPQQDLLMIYKVDNHKVYRFNKNNERKGENEILNELSNKEILLYKLFHSVINQNNQIFCLFYVCY